MYLLGSSSCFVANVLVLKVLNNVFTREFQLLCG